MIKGNNSVFYIPNPSPWPIFFSARIFNIFCVLLIWAEGAVLGNHLIGFFSVSVLVVFLWFLDVYRERRRLGFSSFEIDSSLKISMVWFIGREIIFFFSFFSSYIALGSCTEITTGAIWPPIHIPLVLATAVPLLNTMVLLRRGISLTWSHHIIISGHRGDSMLALLVTLILAVRFSLLQLFEYMECDFSLNDSFFGGIFFIATGFHGLHVVLGSAILLIVWVQIFKDNDCRNSNHVLFEISSWYWHFVDVVWLFLFLIMYCNIV